MIKPKLKGFDLSMIVLSMIIGMGIFKTPGIVAANTGNPLLFFVSWIFGGIICWFGAITFAEIGSRFPVAGGSYKVLSLCYRPEFAFMVNWIQVLSNAASIGAISLVGAEYLSNGLLPDSFHDPKHYLYISSITILILFGLNFLGIKIGAKAQNFISVFKIVLILILCSAVFLPSNPENALLNYSPLPLLQHPLSSAKAFGLGLLGVFFAYEGYQWVINFGGDTINPSKNIPRAIFIGVSLVILLYFFLNFTFFKVVGFSSMAHSSSLASIVGGRLFGKWGFAFTSILLFGSVLGYVNAGLLSNPRMYYAMAEDGVLPPIFKKINPQTQVQEFVLSLFTAFIFISMFFSGTFEKMLDYIIFFDNIGLGAGAITLFILRRRNFAMSPDNLYQMKFYPLIPIVFVSALGLVSLAVFIKEWHSAVIGFGLFLAGYPLFFLLKNSKPTTPEIRI